VIDAFGSVQNVSWLDEEEKKVFKTAFEINQEVVIRYAAARQKYIDQGQVSICSLLLMKTLLGLHISTNRLLRILIS